MSISWPERPTATEWRGRIAREAERQTSIELAFDRADAFERLGDLEQALEWLDQANAISGGLPPDYRAKQARLAYELRAGNR